MTKTRSIKTTITEVRLAGVFVLGLSAAFTQVSTSAVPT
jgi:hypothetical protein